MDLDEALIEEVRNRTLLFDPGHPDYKYLKKKKYAWTKIAANLNFSEVECKKRWKGLRDSYKRCKRMQQLASINGAETPPKKWKYFEAMTFLESVGSSRRTVGNTYNDEDDRIIDIIDVDSADSCLSPTSECSTSLQEKKKTDSEKYQEFLDLAASSISQTCEAFAKQKDEKDTTTLYFACLARKIKEANMPPHLVNRIEAKVSELVFEELELFHSKAKTT